MKFSDPFWFIPGIAACALLIWSFRAFDRRQLAAMATFASGHLLAQLTASLSARRRLFKRALLFVGVACMFAALARPQWGFRWQEAKRRGVDVLFAVDTSKSMLTQDVKPDRLERAKLAVTDMVGKLDGDRVGLIAFAGTAYLQAPLTLDYDAFGESLDALDTNTIPHGGTNIASAILEAQKDLSLEGNNQKILILMTDGEDLDAEGITAAGAAAKDGVKIFTVGIGTASGGLIPVPSDNGGTEYVKDANGQLVTSHLDEKTLTQIEALPRELDQRGRFLIDFDARAPICVDPGGDTRVAVAAVLLLDTPGFLRCQRADRQGGVLAHRRHQDLAGTRHRGKLNRQEILAPGFDD